MKLNHNCKACLAQCRDKDESFPLESTCWKTDVLASPGLMMQTAGSGADETGHGDTYADDDDEDDDGDDDVLDDDDDDDKGYDVDN